MLPSLWLFLLFLFPLTLMFLFFSFLFLIKKIMECPTDESVKNVCQFQSIYLAAPISSCYHHFFWLKIVTFPDLIKDGNFPSKNTSNFHECSHYLIISQLINFCFYFYLESLQLVKVHVFLLTRIQGKGIPISLFTKQQTKLKKKKKKV